MTIPTHHLLPYLCRVVFFVIASFTIFSFSHAKALRVVTEHFPPFQIAPSNNAPEAGIALNFFKRIQQELGRDEKAEFLPWARAYKIVDTENHLMH
ncbi:hypothetical protein [Pseudoalteromonas sp. S16_S37]|uniref:hypothetical protein n=1 Tax=Pseudoalteromonas sp. S16_S37 TaxID=2720228 RepID=UPI0016813512|nr:hypothetical protein [Pseudoalteromonas sp. S16_S37]MBD1581587.1 hypothetical protein [Pseudoalteromonas sp. S16_S37]